jgi:misacylated tRNA(Ala) deacylase
MQLNATTRLYLEDDHCREAEARVIAVQERRFAFDQTCFYPGGGGQPSDDGFVKLQNGEIFQIESVYADDEGIIWHICNSAPAPDITGLRATLIVNKDRRLTLSRYHTVLHILNTITLRDYNGWITGVQIGEDYSRIDFKLENFFPSLIAELEEKVNAIIKEGHALIAYYLPEEEFRKRDDLLRTLGVKPPVSDGQVRVVEIEGFDAQVCGGTHVGNTLEIGRFTIFRTDNKGRINKRFYVRLD